jgi:hypothetical protein
MTLLTAPAGTAVLLAASPTVRAAPRGRCPVPETTPAVALFEGRPDRTCGDHHTVGPHRAWCFDDSEWCYPDGPCHGCDPRIYTQAEMDAAVAAERDRCIRLAVEHGAVYFAEPRPSTCKPGCAQVVSRAPFAPLLGGES